MANIEQKKVRYNYNVAISFRSPGKHTAMPCKSMIMLLNT